MAAAEACRAEKFESSDSIKVESLKTQTVSVATVATLGAFAGKVGRPVVAKAWGGKSHAHQQGKE